MTDLYLCEVPDTILLNYLSNLNLQRIKLFVALAVEKRTFLTNTLIHFLGKYSPKLSLVMQATALVFEACSLYRVELKNVKSLLDAFSNVFISKIFVL